ncbi:hypothetical protein [Nocardia thailandica]|uniref:Uncharacterized protein n=1 Tax=Nocardia thailandica TaxID=257275 RepID=A0ABW6PVS9_9NOCA
MNVRKFCGAAVLLIAGATLVAAPSAQALGPSTGSDQVNLMCLFNTLSAGPKTADCYPVEIPPPAGAGTIGFGPGQLPTGSFGGVQNT